MNYKSELYEEKDEGYFKGVRMDIINLIPEGKNRVLEVGCGFGLTLLKLKELNKAKEIVGVDIVNLEVNHLDNYIVGNIEEITLPYPEEYFDVVICADVLEHLVDPWTTIKKLKKHLKKDGLFIASIPNIRNYKVLFDIVLRGDFKYVDAGILDKTHLRFFCKKNIIEMFDQANMKMIEIKTNLDFGASLKIRFFNALTLKIFEEFFVTQYIIKAQK